ncbi:hypothetical protein CASFOL_022443 [Castilleja foliolosa]|uniref:Uncharacterized protein n=1 Tax=Castilleja foliolosa TaxID=1961234 RepID=A0ABD3CUJ3_9LAMI
MDFANCGTSELIFSNPAQKLFLLCRFIDRYVQIVEEGDGGKKVYMDVYLDNQLMLLGWLSHEMAMPVADADDPFIIYEITNKLAFGCCCLDGSATEWQCRWQMLMALFIISETTNKLIFGWTIVSSSFQDFAYCCTRELIFSNQAQKFFLLCHFIDRHVQIVGEGDGDGVKKVYMDGYFYNQLILLRWLSHRMAMPVADADGPFIISEITSKLVFGWTIMSSSFQDFAYCGIRELIFSNPAQKLFLLCRFVDRYVQIVGEGYGVKKVYMDGYLDNQLIFLGWLSHGMAMPVVDADGPFIISEITNKLFFLLCRLIDRYVHIVGEGYGVKKVYMDGYLDNQLMLLGWLIHGMAMPVADAGGPFIISEITNKLIFRWTILSSSFQDFAYCGTRELIFSNPPQNGNADCPFIISEITNKLIFWWTIMSSSFQDFAYCGTRELIFSNPAQKLFFLCRIIDRYVQIFGEGDGVKKVYMDGYLDNQLMFLGCLSHGMAMPVADADGLLIIYEITNKLIFGWTVGSSSFQDFAYCDTRELIFSNPAQKLFLLCRFIDRYLHIVGEADGVEKGMG